MRNRSNHAPVSARVWENLDFFIRFRIFSIGIVSPPRMTSKVARGGGGMEEKIKMSRSFNCDRKARLMAATIRVEKCSMKKFPNQQTTSRASIIWDHLPSHRPTLRLDL